MTKPQQTNEHMREVINHSTHHGILVWYRNNKLHTIYKKHVYKERKETTHVKIGERTYINNI